MLKAVEVVAMVISATYGLWNVYVLIGIKLRVYTGKCSVHVLESGSYRIGLRSRTPISELDSDEPKEVTYTLASFVSQAA